VLFLTSKISKPKHHLTVISICADCFWKSCIILACLAGAICCNESSNLAQGKKNKMEAEFKDFDSMFYFLSEEVRRSAVIIAVSRYSIFPFEFLLNVGYIHAIQFYLLLILISFPHVCM